MLYYNGAPYAPSVRYGCLNAAAAAPRCSERNRRASRFSRRRIYCICGKSVLQYDAVPGVAGDSAERRRGSRGGVYAGKQGGDPPRFYSRQRAIFFIPRAGCKALRCRQGGCIRSRRGCGRAGAVRRGGYGSPWHSWRKAHSCAMRACGRIYSCCARRSAKMTSCAARDIA